MENNFYDLLEKVGTKYENDINEKINEIKELKERIEKLHKSINDLMDLCIKNIEERLKCYKKEIDKTKEETPDIYIEENNTSVVCDNCGFKLIQSIYKPVGHVIIICPNCGQIMVLKN